MKSKSRLILRTGLLTLGAVLLILLVLTALHAQLQDPGVLSFDKGMQRWVHGWTSSGRTRLMLILTFIGSVKVFLPALGMSLLVLLRSRDKQNRGNRVHKLQIAGVFTYAMAGALLLNEGLKLYFHRARPVLPWSLGNERTFSFPSGHSLFSMILYGLLSWFLLSRSTSRALRSAIPLMSCALVPAIGLSRIYLGMHWPTDVLAGYLAGALWLVAVVWVDRSWRAERGAGQEGGAQTPPALR